MNAAAKKLSEEISELIILATTFRERYYVEEKRFIAFDLHEDLMYFVERAKFIFKSLNHQEYFDMVGAYSFTHRKLQKASFENFYMDTNEIINCLKAVKKELDNNLFYKVSELIKAEVFSNFLDSAKYLLDAGYKDAAAVIIGGVLEDELRTLCDKKGLPIKSEKGKLLTIEPMNENLVKADVYNSLFKTQVTTWANLRNNASHAHYDEYKAKEVQEMYEFVVRFDFSI